MTELTLDDLVARLGKTPKWWKREIAARKHPHLRVGQTIRLTEDDYLAIRESYRAAEEDAPAVVEDDELRPTSRSQARNRKP